MSERFELTTMEFIKAQQSLISSLIVLGFFIFKIEPTLSKTSIALKTSCVLINGAFFLIHIYNYFMSINVYNEVLGDGGEVTKICHILEEAATSFNFILFINGIIWRQRHQIKLLKAFRDLENELKNFSYTHELMTQFYNNLKFNSRLILIGTIFHGTALFVGYLYVFGSEILGVFSLIVFSAECTLAVSFLGNLVNVSKMYVDVINKNLEFCLSRSNFYLNEVHFLLKLHHRITQSIVIFNDAYGIIVFGTFFFVSSSIALELYFLYVTMMMNLNDGSLRHFVLMTLDVTWLMPIVAVMQWLGSSCSHVRESLQKTKSIMSTCEQCDVSVKAVNGFLLTSIEDEYSFTANGFFPIDSSMIYNVSSLAILNTCYIT